jgi:putative lipoprotein
MELVRRGRLGVGAVAIAALALVGPARAEEADPWLGRDKALHFGACAVISAGGYGAAALATEDVRVRVGVGAGAGLAAGVAKELWDLGGHGDPSTRDLAWDVAGTITGVAVAALIDWAVGRFSTGRAAVTQ